MKKLLLLQFIISAFTAYSQDIEVLYNFDSSRADMQDEFLYIEDSIELNILTHVAIVQVSNATGVETLYNFFRNQAGELGANCYRVTEFEHQENGSRIILDLYYANKAAKENIRQHKPQNTVYVFGSFYPGKLYSCKVNDRKIELPPFTFCRQENKPGQEIKVSKGGLTGMTVWVTWAENKPARYITLTGFGLNGVGAGGGGVGVGFNTGRLAYLEPELGRFLSVVMNPFTLDAGK